MPSGLLTWAVCCRITISNRGEKPKKEYRPPALEWSALSNKKQQSCSRRSRVEHRHPESGVVPQHRIHGRRRRIVFELLAKLCQRGKSTSFLPSFPGFTRQRDAKKAYRPTIVGLGTISSWCHPKFTGQACLLPGTFIPCPDNVGPTATATTQGFAVLLTNPFPFCFAPGFHQPPGSLHRRQKGTYFCSSDLQCI